MIQISNQLKYALYDIKNNKITYIILWFQMVVVLLLIAFTISQFISANTYRNKLSKFDNNQAYISLDQSTNEKITYLINHEKDSINKMKELYMYMLSKDKSLHSTIISYNMPELIKGKPIIQYIANEEFFEVFNQNVISGRNFISSDFKNDAEIIPILVGHNLKEKYKLNHIYNIPNAVNGRIQKHKVIGVLKYNSSYVNLDNRQTNFTYLNDGYIKPLNEELITSYDDFSILDLVINSTVVITDNRQEVIDIKEKSNELGLFSLEFITLGENMKIINERSKQLVYYELTILALLLIFSLIGIISALLEMISKKMSEYSIHLMCGATYSSISLRIIIQISLIILISYIPVIILFKFSLPTFYTLLCAILIVLITLVYPIWKIHSEDISLSIRRGR